MAADGKPQAGHAGWFSKHFSLRRDRFYVGVVSFVIGLAMVVGRLGERPLGWAVLLTSIAVLAHLAADKVYGASEDEWDAKEAAEWARVYVTAFIGAPALIFAVFAAFDRGPLALEVKAGVFALGTALLLGVILAGILVAGLPTTPRAGLVMSTIVVVSFAALAFAVLSIGVGLAYR